MESNCKSLFLALRGIGKTVRFLENACHTSAPYRGRPIFTTMRYTIHVILSYLT